MRSVFHTDKAAPPPSRLARCRACHLVLVALVAGLGWGRCAHAGESLATRLRVTISPPQPTAFHGELSVDSGRFERLQALSLSPEAAAASRLVDGGVRWRHTTPVAGDVFDVTVRSDLDAQLVVRLAGEGEAPVRASLAKARNATSAQPLVLQFGEAGTTVTLVRQASDRLRVETNRDSLVFSPGERFAFVTLADPPTSATGEPYDFVATLSRGRSGAEVWRSESVRVEPSGVPARLPVEAPLPSEEGVYRLTLSASKPSGFRTRFLPGAKLLQGDEPPLATRTFQVVVMDPSRRPSRPGDWRETYAFDPRSQRWADRVPEWMRWRRLPWFATGPLSSEDRALPHHDAIEISPTPSRGTAHWRAYPLPIDQPGATYAVEVETLGAPGELLTVAVLEPDALGDLRPVSTPVTNVVPRWNRGAKRAPARLLVRPRTTSPLLVLSNPSNDKAARFGSIRLFKSGGVDGPAPAHERLVALDFSDVDLPHAMGASHARSPIGQFEQPDFVTHRETASLLADRVEAAGANGAVLSINQSGAAIYPSTAWQSPRFDLAAWSEGTADLPRRELLTLVLREFERRGLRLIPALRFDAPTGLMGSQAGPTDYAADSPSAAEARRQIVDELLAACRESDALAGVAVRATPGGWGLMSGDSDSNPKNLAASYAALHAQVAAHGRNAPSLYLLPDALVDDAVFQRSLTPRLAASSASAADLVTQSGLAALLELAGSPQVFSPYGGGLSDRPSALSSLPAVQDAFRRALDAAGSSRVRSLRSAREPVRLVDSARRLRSGEATTVGDVLLPAVVVDPYTEASLLAEAADEAIGVVLLDGHGSAGWIDEAATNRRGTFTALPLPTGSPPVADEAPSTKEAAEKEIDVEAIAYDLDNRESIAVATNHTAWPRSARVTIETPHRLRGARLDASAGSSEKENAIQWFEAGRHVLDLQLEPYESVAWRFVGPGVRVDGVRVDPSPAAQRELAESLADLQSRDTTQRRPFTRLVNPSFESTSLDSEGRPQVNGWRLADGASVDNVDGVSTALLRSTSERPAILISDPFDMPRTGQLVLGLRVRPGVLSPGAELRIDLEQVDGAYRNRASLTASQLQGGGDDSGDTQEWLPPIVFPVDDLPLTQGGQLRLRFSLTGQGELHLDDLQLEDLVLPLDGFGAIDLRAERFAVVRLHRTAQNVLDKGRLEACRELLDSYWARFLIDNFPRSDEETVVAETSPTDEDKPADEAEATPSLSERVRGYLWPWR